MNGDEFLKFQEFFYRKTGIMFGEGKRYFVDRRIAERVKAGNHATFRDYFSALRFDHAGTEMQRLINLMTVNETYFYREDYQFRCLVVSMLPEIVRHKRPGERVRFWCMPCSTGEEPYSLAIYLLEHWDRVDDYDIEIVGSDIDTTVLNAARQGVYGERSLQQMPTAVRDRYFRREGEGQWRISEDLRNSLQFTRVNLSDAADTRSYRDFDVVFCRNLLIYFDDASRRAAAETLYDAMVPGGYICLGHSESMSRISPLFAVRRHPDAIVYQRPTGRG